VFFFLPVACRCLIFYVRGANAWPGAVRTRWRTMASRRSGRYGQRNGAACGRARPGLLDAAPWCSMK
jgi:hypothetical protein